MLTAGKIYLVENPGLDYEAGPTTYELTITVTDGSAFAGHTVSAKFTVFLSNVNEPPVFHNLPAQISLTETFTGLAFTVNVTDEDAGDVITLSMPAMAEFSLGGSTGMILLFILQILVAIKTRIICVLI